MAYALGEVEGAVLIDAAVAQHHELVAADAGYDVGRSGGVKDAMCHLGKQGVTHIVTNRIVDLLQAVDVDEQHRHMVPAAPDVIDGVRRRAQQKEAVGKSGEWVVVCLAGEFGLEVLGGGDVAGDPTPVVDDTFLGAVHQHVEIEGALESVGAAKTDLTGPLGGTRIGHHLARYLIADRLQQAPSRGVADQVDLFGDPEQGASGRVGVERRSVAVEDDYRVACGGHDTCQAVQ